MATKINLTMDQASTFNMSFTVIDVFGNPTDFTTYTLTSQMRKTFSSLNAYSFTVNGYSNGTIVMSMNAATTANISDGRYVYDIESTSNTGVKSRIVEGLLTVTPQVTR
jgi:hypothetical protein